MKMEELRGKVLFPVVGKIINLQETYRRFKRKKRIDNIIVLGIDKPILLDAEIFLATLVLLLHAGVEKIDTNKLITYYFEVSKIADKATTK